MCRNASYLLALPDPARPWGDPPHELVAVVDIEHENADCAAIGDICVGARNGDIEVTRDIGIGAGRLRSHVSCCSHGRS